MTKEQLRNYLSIKAERAQIQALLDEMEAALEKFLSIEGSCLMEILVDPMETVQ